jgi:hypothetical protein
VCVYFVRSILLCKQTGYEAGSCACILLGLYFSVNRQDMKRDRVSVICYVDILVLTDRI